MFLKFLLLLKRKTLSVVRFTFEWQRVEWILWMLLMEDVAVAILPIWKCCSICWILKNWFFVFLVLLWVSSFWFDVGAFELVSSHSLALHAVRVDYLCFLLKVEGFLLLYLKSSLQRLHKVLLITCKQALWVWIANELICNSWLLSTVVVLLCGSREV